MLTISVPEVTGFKLEDARNKISNSKLQYQVVGSGDTVLRQLPESGNQVLNGGVVLLYTEDTGDKTVTVPNLIGLTATEANREAGKAGINIEFSGNTTTTGIKAYNQSIEAGQSVNAGTIVTVYFRDDTAVDG